MNIQETINMLQDTIDKLKQYDPNTEVAGHVAYPSTGYSGDVDGCITALKVEEWKEWNGQIIIGLHYE